ncbi:hypothetical protein [Dyella sp.]|uniref:hypothetical protein n=1 Tax=Dyella sp. TaxID=1869338 RepID=UPI002ED19BDC
MTAGRTFTAFADKDPEARTLLESLPTLKGDIKGYREHMRRLGAHLAASMFPTLKSELTRDICVICTVEDADFLARGVIEELESHRARTRMICMWNARVKSGGISISPVVRTYEEVYDKSDVVFVIVKSIISGACVVKTNLTKAITTTNPKRVFVVSPVMLKDAEKRLANEFPDELAKKFEFVHFATDSCKSSDGEEVIPGIGGSVYELLGLGDVKKKNTYIPAIVKERRRKEFPQLQTMGS